MATLQEINSCWTLDDIRKANAILDIKQSIMADQLQKATKGIKSGRRR